MPDIEYKVIDGFPRYRVGSDGSVWSRTILGGPFPKLGKTWRRLKENASGYYLRVGLTDGSGHVTRKAIHLLVLTAFRGNPPPGMEARHLNGHEHDNRLDNLAWGTHQENIDDKSRHGTNLVGVNHPCAKLTEAQVQEIRRLINSGMSYPKIGRLFGVSKYPIWAIANKKNWTHLQCA